MKILQIFGAVVAVHVLAFILIFASPGCQSGPRNIPTPDATVPSSVSAPVNFNTPAPSAMAPTPVDNGYATTPAAGSYASPTRPGSPNAAAYTPAPKPVAEVAPVSTYTVTRGDSLWSIAKKHKISAAELARTNNLATNAILQPGKKLIVPGAAPVPQDLATTAPAEKTALADKPATRTNGESIKHTVQSGETLGAIAKRYGVKVADLVTENSITNPALVRAGQQLSIPGTRAAARAANTPAQKQTVSTPTATAPTPSPAAQTPATQTPPVEASPTSTNSVPRIEIAPPPPGEDLDAGLKETSTEVPTIKVDLPPPPKN